MRKPLAIDLYCGLGGWAEGLLAEGWDVIGFDIERHVYGDQKYPGLLVTQDAHTLHGSQFRNADLIVASPPCQEYSYMAMPWKRAKAIAAEYRSGKRDVRKLTELFDTCFRIQREACEAAGRHIPLVVENVRGAEPWVGQARARYGSFYLWGDVPVPQIGMFGNEPRQSLAAVQAQKFNPDGTNHGQGSWFKIADSKNRGAKLPGFRVDGSGRSFQTASVEGMKAPAGTRWFNDGPRTPESLATSSSKSPARKAASAMIAKIPEPLARHIARAFKPRE